MSLADAVFSPSRQLWGVGKLCELLKMTPHELNALREAAGVDFVLLIDGCGFVDSAGLQRMYEKGRELVAVHKVAEQN